jgi:hypothetical protein
VAALAVCERWPALAVCERWQLTSRRTDINFPEGKDDATCILYIWLNSPTRGGMVHLVFMNKSVHFFPKAPGAMKICGKFLILCDI